MRTIKTLNKGQKVILFLFFIFVMIFAYLRIGMLIKVAERVHSKVIISTLKNYEKVKKENLTYHYKENDTQYVEEVVDKTQTMMKEVEKNFGNIKTKLFDIIIYPSSMEMNTGLRLPSGEKTLGAYYGGNIFLLSPSQLDTKDSQLENVILHEYTHLLVEEKTKGNHPVWFTEGVALYQEYLITGYEWGNGYEFSQYTPYTLEQLDEHFYQLDTFMAYRASFLRVKFLAERYSSHSVFTVMEKMGENKDYNEAIQETLGKNKKELENEFIVWYDRYFYGKL